MLLHNVIILLLEKSLKNKGKSHEIILENLKTDNSSSLLHEKKKKTVREPKSWLKFNVQKTKNRASGLITSWQIDGETVETVADFILGGSKITADGDCSHEVKRRLLLGRKVMINLDSILKSRDITLPTKVHQVKTMVFPVVMYDVRVGL